MQKTLWIASAGSALLGGASGALATLWLAGAPAAPSKAISPEAAAHGPIDSDLARRVEALEGSVRTLQRTRELSARASAALGDPHPADPSGAELARDKPIVDDPVFEAAVLDVLDRAEETRASERVARREEQRKDRVERWANELAASLRLTPAQRDKLLELRHEFSDAARRELDVDGGAPPSRRERRARIEALRAEAEKKLAGVLDGRQMQAYEKLDPELRLGARR